MVIKLIKIEKANNKKNKYTAIFNIDNTIKKTSFGSFNMSDYTINKDPKRKQLYINRHKKDLKTNDLTRPGFLSMGILWSKPNLKDAVDFYNNLINDYNKNNNIEDIKKKLLFK